MINNMFNMGRVKGFISQSAKTYYFKYLEQQ